MSFWSDLLNNSALGTVLERQNATRRAAQERQDTIAANMAQNIATQQANRTFSGLARQDALAFETNPENVRQRAEAKALQDKYDIEARLANKETYLQERQMQAEGDALYQSKLKLAELQALLNPDMVKMNQQIAVNDARAKAVASTDPAVIAAIRRGEEEKTKIQIEQNKAIAAANRAEYVSPEATAFREFQQQEQIAWAVNKQNESMKAADIYATTPQAIEAARVQQQLKIEGETKSMLAKVDAIIKNPGAVLTADVVQNMANDVKSITSATGRLIDEQATLNKMTDRFEELRRKVEQPSPAAKTINVDGKNVTIRTEVDRNTNQLNFVLLNEQNETIGILDPETLRDTNRNLYNEVMVFGNTALQAALDTDDYIALQRAIPTMQMQVSKTKAELEAAQAGLKSIMNLQEANILQQEMATGNSPFSQIIKELSPTNPKPVLSQPTTKSLPWGGQ